MLARNDGIAIWRKIADELAGDIARGVFAAGAKLPTEAALAERFSVHRHTVRQALSELARQGLVRSRRGAGTFVEALPLAYPIGTRTRFSEIVMAQARDPAGVLLSARTEPARPDIAVALALSNGAPVSVLETLRTADGVPLIWATLAVPAHRFPAFADDFAESGSITASFRRAGVRDYLRRSTRIGARPADPHDARLLEIEPHRPLIVIESVNVDTAGTPIQWTLSHCAADRVRIEVET